MLQELLFVRGALAKKDLLPVLTHFRLYQGRIQGGNGRVAIDIPCPSIGDLDILVPGERFLKAVDACDGEPELSITKGERLSVKRGSFRAYLPLLEPEAYPLEYLDGHPVVTDGSLLDVFKRLGPFVGEDASRPWACGILLDSGQAYATNNISLAVMPSPWSSFNESVVIPGYAIAEILRIGQEPKEIRLVEGQSASFEFDNGGWLKTTLIDLPWPDLTRLLDITSCRWTQVDISDLRAAISRVLPFCSDPDQPQVYFGPEGIRTPDGTMSAQMEGIVLPLGRWRVEPLQAALGEAIRIDLSQWPGPCPWEAEGGLKGLIIGLKDPTLEEAKIA